MSLFFVQLTLVFIFLSIFVWQSIILIAVRNAVKTSQIPPPLFWLFISVANLLLSLIGLIAVFLLQFQ